MRFSPSAFLWLAAVAAVAVAGLPDWIASIDSTGGLEAVFFRQVEMPSGPIPVLRPPSETRTALGERISAEPSRAELYALRAYEAERQLDFAAAEADWKRFAELAPDRAAASLALADFYRRRLQSREEVAQLLAAARAPAAPGDRFLPVERQRAWQALSRAAKVVEDHLLPPESLAGCYRAWIERYPREQAVYRAYADAAIKQSRWAEAAEAAKLFEKDFPDDRLFGLTVRARIEAAQGKPEAALSLFDRALGPATPSPVVQEYFRLLRKHGRLRDYLETARTAAAANPLDWPAHVRIFFYYQQQGDLPSAQRVLVEYRQRRDARGGWQPAERLELAALLESVRHWDEAARACYAVTMDPAADAASKEAGLAGLIRILLNAPEERISIGRGDLTLYRDIGSFDPYPGFLNGLLSLVLNGADPAGRYAEREANSAAYFHRAKAAELLAEFDKSFPASPRRAPLHAALIEAYAAYNDAATVINRGEAFLKQFPRAAERVAVSLRVAEAHARLKRLDREFQVYDALLKELAAQAEGVPLGEIGEWRPSEDDRRRVRRMPQEWKPARSPEYARILDRYIARLVAAGSVKDALAVYRRELQRNPNDPGLYERLAAFLDQNKLGGEIEEVYRRAIAQFPDRSWHHKLARWYLRQRRAQEFDKLTREVAGIFSGAELERYLNEASAGGPLDPQLYLRVNQYAWKRFPWNLTFVKNLINAYERRETANPQAAEQLLRRYWLYDDHLRSRFFERLSRGGRLEKELETVRAAAGPQNPAALRFVAEAEAWACRFESAAPHFRAIAGHYPGDAEVVDRAIAVYRSLAAYDPANTAVAAELAQMRTRAEPGNAELLATAGDIYAERGQLDRARPLWDRMPDTSPGLADRYLDAATVYWDYFGYDDALRLLELGRKRLNNPALHAYQAGAIHENKRQYPQALAEYLKDLAPPEGEQPETEAAPPRTSSVRRLIRLSRLPATKDLVESATAKLAAPQTASPDAISLRAAVLDAQGRKEELAAWLTGLARTATSAPVLARIDSLGAAGGFEEVRGAVLRRRVETVRDPVEKLRLRIELAVWTESRGDIPAAQQMADSILNDHPRILGAVRAAADLHWRTGSRGRAIEILERAAASSYPDLRRRFLREAASKATTAGSYARARGLLETLLKETPFDASIIAAMAETWEREGNWSALRSFYAVKIEELRKSPLPAAEKDSRLAAMRRAYIPILARLKDHPAAVDQYIEILARFPGDESVALEAAQFAFTHGQRDRLRAWCARAASESPKDARWLILLARLDTHFEDYPNAIASYQKASAIRPDRTDLLLSRAALQERLLQFEDAAAAYERVYELTYHNPQWMEKAAEVRARQGRAAEAVRALEKAWLEGRPPRARNFFRVARSLEGWEMLAEARAYAEKALDAAGQGLVMDRETEDGLRTYARVAARLGAYEAAWNRMVAAGGIANVLPALSEMAAALKRHGTDAQRNAFASFLEKQRAAHPPDMLQGVFLPIVRAGGYAELEARWIYQALMLKPGDEEMAPWLDTLVSLQSARMRHEELGLQLEAYWNVHPNNDQKAVVLQRAADAFRAAGNVAAEMRLRAHLRDARYYELLARFQPGQLAAEAARSRGFETLEAAVRYAAPQDAFRAISARGGAGLPPVWTDSYLAVAGIYGGVRTAEIRRAFDAILGPMVVRERLAARPDPRRVLVDHAWYYYAARFGEYLAAAGDPAAADFLPAALEGAPASPKAYWDLGEYYYEAGDTDRASSEYAFALQLDPTMGAAAARAARILFDKGDSSGAAARWQEAFEAFRLMQERGRPPAAFWRDVREALADISRRGQTAAVRPALDAFLTSYIRSSGGFRIAHLLQPLLENSRRPAQDMAWIANLTRVSSDRTGTLEPLWQARWLPEAAREPLIQAIIESAIAEVEKAPLGEREWKLSNLNEWRFRWLEYLISRKESARARRALEEIPEEFRNASAGRTQAAEIRLAVLESQLPLLIERWRRVPESAPSADVLLRAAGDLRLSGDAAAARRVLEYLYSQNLAAFRLEPSNFLGLAEVKLEEGAASEALSLLRRMALVSSDPFGGLLPAARLLERFGHRAEAAEFAGRRVKAVPWDAEARELVRRLTAPPAAPPQPDLARLQREIAANPFDAALRLQLFEALRAAGRHAAAVAAFHPLLAASGLEWAVQHAEAPMAVEDEPGAPAFQGHWTHRFLSATGLPPPRRAAYAEAASECYEAIGQPGAAAVMAAMAHAIEPSAERAQRLSRLERAVQLRIWNLRRAPSFSASVHQPRVVRPRLTALPGGGK